MWTRVTPLIRRTIHVAVRFRPQLRPPPSDLCSHSSRAIEVGLVGSRFPARFYCPNGIDRGDTSCWNCRAASSAEPFLFCGSCRSVQPVDESVNYFQIFGLDKSYEIGENLERKYKDWQKKLHPDLVHSKSEKEKNFAAEQSARVIDAYRTLNKPLSRALYLLKLEGVHVDEEKTVTDPELLAEMMELREAVEETNDQQTLEQIKSQIQRKFDSWSSSFQQAFNKKDFEAAITSTQRMRYYERALEEIVNKTD